MEVTRQLQLAEPEPASMQEYLSPLDELEARESAVPD